MSWSKRELQCVFDLFFFSCAPRAPQNQCWHREASCFSSTWSRTHARSTLNGGGRGDGSTTWKSEVKYWPLLWVSSSFLSKSSDSFETCRVLFGSKNTTHTPTLQELLSLQAAHCGQQPWRPSALKNWLALLVAGFLLVAGILLTARRLQLGNCCWGWKELTEADKSDTMLDHACVWARACVALLVARNSQWQTLPSHIYHTNHPAYSTHSVNTQYTLSRRYSKRTVSTCKKWEIWSMWVLTYSLLHSIVASKVDTWKGKSYISQEFTVCLL